MKRDRKKRYSFVDLSEIGEYGYWDEEVEESDDDKKIIVLDRVNRIEHEISELKEQLEFILSDLG